MTILGQLIVLYLHQSVGRKPKFTQSFVLKRGALRPLGFIQFVPNTIENDNLHLISVSRPVIIVCICLTV